MRLLGGLGIRAVRNDPVILSVSEVRGEILAAGHGVRGERSSNRMLGRIFHESIADVFRPGPKHWQDALTPSDLSDPSILARHVYACFVGPRLTRYQAALQESSGEVLSFWTAVKEWCQWFCGIVRTGLDTNQIQYDEAAGKWMNAGNLVEPERHLSCVLTDPSWTAPVMIQGRADGVLR